MTPDPEPATPAPAAEKAKPEPRIKVLAAKDRAFTEKVRAELRVPGSRLGALARAYERLIIDAQEALNNHGGDVVVAKVLDHEERVPIRVGFDLALHVQVGKGTVKSYPVSLLHTPPVAAGIAVRPTTSSTATASASRTDRSA